MKLTLDQVRLIRESVDKEGIKIDSLKEDLIDHLCCALEEKLEQPQEFFTVLDHAIAELAPDGFEAIENETVFLLNLNKLMLMKKFMYSIGLISSMAVTVGFTMVLLRLPAAQEILTSGLVAFGVVFIPLLAFDYFKTNSKTERQEKYRMIFGLLSALIFSLGVTLKLLHLPAANELLVLGALVFSFGFLPFQFLNVYRKSVS
jgi:hypothetical protein